MFHIYMLASTLMVCYSSTSDYKIKIGLHSKSISFVYGNINISSVIQRLLSKQTKLLIHWLDDDQIIKDFFFGLYYLDKYPGSTIKEL